MRPVAPAPIVNSVLAKALANEANPMELLAEDQDKTLSETTWKVGTANLLSSRGRPALLACGHFTMTKSLYKARCIRCGEMIRSGYDYDGFRRLGNPDDFSWPDDPFRLLHENQS